MVLFSGIWLLVGNPRSLNFLPPPLVNAPNQKTSAEAQTKSSIGRVAIHATIAIKYATFLEHPLLLV